MPPAVQGGTRISPRGKAGPPVARLSMNSAFHRPYSIKIEPSIFALGQDIATLVDLHISYKQGGGELQLLRVHLEERLQPEFRKGRVEGFDAELLQRNGVASRTLPGAPEYVVTGIVLKGGTNASGVPKSLVNARRAGLLFAGTLLVTGAALALSPLPWLGGLLAGLSAIPLRRALAVPVRAYFGRP